MEPTWVRKSGNGTSVVFVHGILSSIESAWLSANGVFWPRMLCEETAIDDVGVYLFGYRADAFSGTYSLDDAVDSMRQYLRLDGVWSEKQLIFVCHSMGGIVVRRFLISQQAELIETDKRIGLFLVASPSLGSTYANLATSLAPFYNVQLDALRFSQQNAWLNALDRDFLNLKERGRVNIFGRELVEDNFIIAKRLFRSSQVVAPWAGAKYFGEPLKIAHSDHLTIAKPETSTAIQHRVLVEFIQNAIAEADKDKHSSAKKTEPTAISDAVAGSEVFESVKSKTGNPILVEWPPGLQNPGVSGQVHRSAALPRFSLLAGLERFPPELNRKDSQKVTNERICAH